MFLFLPTGQYSCLSAYDMVKKNMSIFNSDLECPNIGTVF